MTYEEAVSTIEPGRYRHFKGNEYEVIGIARHSEDESPVVVYRALYGEGGLWIRPAEMWNETVTRDGRTCQRFERIRS
ncbi:MAG: DUF1653 domain-containing protein [Clostridia bacterium]|nr:DUF1653 domain-containing protein [Clostridia bacterium]